MSNRGSSAPQRGYAAWDTLPGTRCPGHAAQDMLPETHGEMEAKGAVQHEPLTLWLAQAVSSA